MGLAQSLAALDELAASVPDRGVHRAAGKLRRAIVGNAGAQVRERMRARTLASIDAALAKCREA